jgi:hypothetical protein
MYDPSIEPLYVISLEEVFWGAALVAVTMTLHGFGMQSVLRVNGTVKRWSVKKRNFLRELFPVIIASWMIMIVHMIEVVVWAAFFVWTGAFPNSSVAYYFALNEYTTLGSNFSLPLHYRLLEGMIAIAGLLTFAWSTGVLVTLAQGLHDNECNAPKIRGLVKDHNENQK